MTNYTYRWNTPFVENINRFGLKNLDLCLEIGCFEGLSSNYICDNVLSESGLLVCLDPLTDNYLNYNLTAEYIQKNQTEYAYFNNQYERFINNTKHQNDKIQLVRKISSEAFPELLTQYSDKFDLIYIDGDHRASSVYIDAINSYALCKPSGYIVFDDYAWGKHYYEESTSIGIDKFLNEFTTKINILRHEDQIVIKKI